MQPSWTFHDPTFATLHTGTTLHTSARVSHHAVPPLGMRFWRLRTYVVGLYGEQWCTLTDVVAICPEDATQEDLGRHFLNTLAFWTWPLARDASSLAPIGLDALAQEKAAWSLRTFGPGERTRGLLEHLRRELAEIERTPHDLTEWVDVILLAMDGYHRHGGKSLLADLRAKHHVNLSRTWPKPTSEDVPGEHDRVTP